MDEKPIGQGIQNTYMEIGGENVEVLTTSYYAHITGYSISWVRQMCEEGKLIAIKRYGRWWILVDYEPPKDGDDLLF